MPSGLAFLLFSGNEIHLTTQKYQILRLINVFVLKTRVLKLRIAEVNGGTILFFCGAIQGRMKWRENSNGSI